MTRLTVSEDIANSLLYITTNFNATDVDFLYDNASYLKEKFDTKALKVLTKKQLIEAFLYGYNTRKAMTAKDLPNKFKLKVKHTKLLLVCERIDSMVLIKDDADVNEDRFPYDVERVVKLINDTIWEIV